MAPARQIRSRPSRRISPARAKNVIFLFQEGGPSQIDLYDPKPALQKWHGKPLPRLDDERSESCLHQAGRQGARQRARVSSHYGKSGVEFSDYIPNIASCADDICLVRSTVHRCVQSSSGPVAAVYRFHAVRHGPLWAPGSSYGLGSESQDLPGVRGAQLRVAVPAADRMNWSSGFLPSTYPGVVFRNSGDPILYLPNPPGVSRETQRARLDAIVKLNQERSGKPAILAIASRISLLRTRVSDANGGAGAARFLEGIAGHAGHVRREQRAHASVCDELPARAANGGARRALRHAGPCTAGTITRS